MQDQHPIRDAERTQPATTTADASRAAPLERITISHFFVRPHGLEPGKALAGDAVFELLAPPSVTDLLCDMREARRQSDHLEFATLAYLGLTLLAVVGFAFSDVADLDRKICGVIFIGALCLATLNASIRFLQVGSSQSAIARLMSRHHDLRVVGYLTEALARSDHETRQLAALALRYLLPRLQAHHVELLNEAQRLILYRYLRGHDVELALAILKALEQVGDAKAVPAVQHLTEEGVRVDARVRTAAEECLPYLLLRAERAAAPRVLLRASSNMDADPRALLRTVNETHPADADQLLRTTE